MQMVAGCCVCGGMAKIGLVPTGFGWWWGQSVAWLIATCTEEIRVPPPVNPACVYVSDGFIRWCRQGAAYADATFRDVVCVA